MLLTVSAELTIGGFPLCKRQLLAAVVIFGIPCLSTISLVFWLSFSNSDNIAYRCCCLAWRPHWPLNWPAVVQNLTDLTGDLRLENSIEYPNYSIHTPDKHIRQLLRVNLHFRSTEWSRWREERLWCRWERRSPKMDSSRVKAQLSIVAVHLITRKAAYSTSQIQKQHVSLSELRCRAGFNRSNMIAIGPTQVGSIVENLA